MEKEAISRAATNLSMQSPSEYISHPAKAYDSVKKSNTKSNASHQSNSSSSASLMSHKTSIANKFDLVTLLEVSNHLTSR